MKLIEIIADIENYDDLMTVYAKKDWNPNSEAMVIEPPEDGNIRPIDGYDYFLEVFIIKEWIEDLKAKVNDEVCIRIIMSFLKLGPLIVM